MPNVDKRIRKLENDLASSDEEQPIKKSSSKKNKLEKRRQKKMTLSSSDEETTDDKNQKNKTLEKDRLPKPDISQPKKKTDKELEKQNLSEGRFKIQKLRLNFLCRPFFPQELDNQEFF